MQQSANNAAPWGAQGGKGYWQSAAQVFRDRRAVVTAGMLLALHIILSMFLGIYLTQTVKLSVAFITNVMTGYLFGPCMALVTGALGDILQYILKPVGGYFFGWTLNAAIGGFVYGLAFYRRAPRELAAHGGGSVRAAGVCGAGDVGGQNGKGAVSLPGLLSGGILVLMLACWAVMPFLAAPARQYPAAVVARVLANSPFSGGPVQIPETGGTLTGSALGFLTGRAGACANASPHTLALVSLVLILAGLVFVLGRRRLPVVILSAAACLWLLPVYTDRKVLAAKSGFALLCIGFAVCAAINLLAVLRARALDAGFLLRCFVTMLFMAVVVQMFLGTVWCTVMYGKGFWFYFVPRAIKSLIQLPFNAILAYYVIRAVKRLGIAR